MEYITSTLGNLMDQTAFFNLTVGNYVMILVACVFLYLAIAKGFEPLLLVPIAFGMLLVNIYPDIMMSIEESSNGVGGLLHYFYLLDEWAILPSLTQRVSFSVPQRSLVSLRHTLEQWQWDSLTKRQQQFQSSVEQMDRHLFSLPENCSRLQF